MAATSKPKKRARNSAAQGELVPGAATQDNDIMAIGLCAYYANVAASQVARAVQKWPGLSAQEITKTTIRNWRDRWERAIAKNISFDAPYR